MKLTRFQYHKWGYGLQQWGRCFWKSWLVLAGMGVWAFIVVVPAAPGMGCTLVGFCLGVWLRDVGDYQLSRHLWTVSDRIIDWPRVQELVDNYSNPMAKPPACPMEDPGMTNRKRATPADPAQPERREPRSREIPPAYEYENDILTGGG
jgi:hypothetical protein